MQIKFYSDGQMPYAKIPIIIPNFVLYVILQFVLDTDYKSGCPKVLYRADDDRMVFPKILFDPVDHNYIYIALRNQVSWNWSEVCQYIWIYKMKPGQVINSIKYILHTLMDILYDLQIKSI